MKHPSPIPFLSLVSVCLAWFVTGWSAAQTFPPAQHLVRLGAGSGLVSMQVDSGMSPEAFRYSLSNPARLQQIS